MEASDSVGLISGCDDHDSKSACESFRATARDAEESYDKSTRHCRWLPRFEDAKAKTSACEADGKCAWKDSDCKRSDETEAKQNEWEEKIGVECERRTPSGCYENNDHLGESETCTQHTDANSCTAATKTDHSGSSGNGVCSGDLKAASSGDCDSTQKVSDLRPEDSNCDERVLDDMCVANNEDMSQGDGASSLYAD
jgi:hypothetical protein